MCKLEWDNEFQSMIPVNDCGRCDCSDSNAAHSPGTNDEGQRYCTECYTLL